MASQPLAYGELLAGGVILAAAVTGHAFRDILASKSSPIKALTPTAPVSEGSAFSGGSLLASAPASVNSQGQGGAMPQGPRANPLPGWKRSRIDQGVDFYGGRKIVAPGSGTVLKTGAPGWPGGGGVLLKLDSGQIVFFYEQLTAIVKAGQKVIAGQQIASGTPGGSIEVGFADAAGVPLAHAGYTEGKVTEWGRKAAAWLSSLGTSGGAHVRPRGGK